MSVRTSRRSTLWARAGALVAFATLLGSAYYFWSSRRAKQGDTDTQPPNGVTSGDSRASSRSASRRGSTTVVDVAKRILKGRRVMTISMKNIVVWNPSPDPTTPNHAFRESALPFLHSLVSNPSNQVHLIMVVTSDQEEAQVRTLLHSSGLYTAGLDPRRVVFCSTEEGKAHIVRHIEPHVHVDSCDDVIKRLAPFVGRIIRVQRRVQRKGNGVPPGMNGRVASAPGVIGGNHGNGSPGSGKSSRRTSSTSGGLGLIRTPTFNSLDWKDATASDVGSETEDDHDPEEGLQDLKKLGNVEFVDSLAQSGLLGQ
ncbi:hypothetical protein SpCBS45565_g02669 [Spizellomyces sp. 'palustris']|nr:hypothetical protein SpCBS45565_g02669 [Spizellomyces sp. 'palustris']